MEIACSPHNIHACSGKDDGELTKSKKVEESRLENRRMR